jgi:hypothetical protein
MRRVEANDRFAGQYGSAIAKPEQPGQSRRPLRGSGQSHASRLALGLPDFFSRNGDRIAARLLPMIFEGTANRTRQGKSRRSRIFL